MEILKQKLTEYKDEMDRLKNIELNDRPADYQAQMDALIKARARQKKALDTQQGRLDNVQARAGDEQSLSALTESLKKVQDAGETANFTALEKKLEEVSKRFDGLLNSAKQDIKLPANLAKATAMIEAARAEAEKQARAKNAREAALAASSAERDTERARLDIMADSVEKRRALLTVEIADEKAKAEAVIAKYRDQADEVARIRAALDGRIASMREQQLREEREFITQIVDAAKERADREADARLSGEQRTLAEGRRARQASLKQQAEDVAKLAGDPTAQAEVKASGARFRQLNALNTAEQSAQQRREEQALIADSARAQQEALTKLNEIRARTQARAMNRELAAVEGNLQAEMRIRTRYAQLMADTQAKALRDRARRDADKTLEDAQKAASAPGTSAEKSAQLIATARSEAAAILAGAEADVSDLYTKAGDDVAQQALRAQETALTLARTQAETAGEFARSASERQAAQAQILAGLQDEVNLAQKRLILAQQTGGDTGEARQAVQQAQAEQLRGQRDLREQLLQDVLSTVDATEQQIELGRSQTSNAQTLLQLEQNSLNALKQRVDILSQARGEAQTLDEQRELTDQLTAAQIAYNNAVEQAGEKRRADAEAVLQLRADLAAAATAAGENLAERSRGRLDNLKALSDQAAALREQEAAYARQGRSVTELGRLSLDRLRVEQEARDLLQEQADDLQTLADLQTRLNSAVLNLRSARAGLFDAGSAQRLALAAQTASDRLTELRASTQAYTQAVGVNAGQVSVSEKAADGLATALERQQSAIQNAQDALSGLRGEWDAQNTAVSRLLNTLGQYAEKSRDQGTLDALASRSQDAFSAALDARARALSQFGAGSEQYVASEERVAAALAATEAAIQAAARNRAEAIRNSTAERERADARIRSMVSVPENLALKLDVSRVQEQADAIARQADAQVQALARQALGTSDALDTAMTVFQKRADTTAGVIQQTLGSIQSSAEATSIPSGVTLAAGQSAGQAFAATVAPMFADAAARISQAINNARVVVQTPNLSGGGQPQQTVSNVNYNYTLNGNMQVTVDEQRMLQGLAKRAGAAAGNGSGQGR